MESGDAEYRFLVSTVGQAAKRGQCMVQLIMEGTKQEYKTVHSLAFQVKQDTKQEYNRINIY